MDKSQLAGLAHIATACLIEQQPVVYSRHKDDPRNGFPLPIKRTQPDADGYITQQYRPLAILEYVNDTLSGELARRQAKERKKEPACPSD